MYKKLFKILICVFVLALTSCRLEESGLFSKNAKNDEEIAKQTIEQLISSIESHDANSIKDMFAETAIADTDNFDASVEKLFDYYNGTMSSYKINTAPYSSGIFSKERICEYVCCSFAIVTDKADYYFYFQTVARDTVNLDNVGIFSLYVIEQSKQDNSEPYTGDGMNTPGINFDKLYTLEDEFLNKANEIKTIINEKNTSMLKSLFSSDSLAEIDNFEEQAQKLFAFCENINSVEFKFEDHNVELCSQNVKAVSGFDNLFLDSQIKMNCENKAVELYLEYCMLNSSVPENEGIITIRAADIEKHPDIDLAMDLKLSTECGIFVVE